MKAVWIALGYTALALLLVIGVPAAWLSATCVVIADAVLDWMGKERA